MKRVLIVEDYLPLRQLLCRLLETSGLDVATATDGIQALEKLRRRKFDVVLLDLGLPRMNGLEVLARLRKRKVRPKVIVITGDEAPETVLRAVRGQAYKYVTKPFEPKMLVETVHAALAAAAAPPAA